MRYIYLSRARPSNNRSHLLFSGQVCLQFLPQSGSTSGTYSKEPIQSLLLYLVNTTVLRETGVRGPQPARHGRWNLHEHPKSTLLYESVNHIALQPALPG
jgi:hypothetical protein